MPSPEMLLEVLLYGGLIPAAVTALVLLLAGRLPFPLRVGGGAGAGALALACGFCVGYGLLRIPPWAPAASWTWLPYLAVVAAIAGMVEGILFLPKAWRWWPRVAVAVTAAWLLFPNLAEFQRARLLWLAAMGGSMLVLWSVLGDWAQRQHRLGPSLLLLVATLTGAAVIEQAGFSRLALLAGVLASVPGAGVVGSWRFPGHGWLRGVAPGFAVVWTGLLFNTSLYHSSDAPDGCFVLALVAPLGLAVAELRPNKRLASPWPLLIQAATVLLPAVLAVCLAAAS